MPNLAQILAIAQAIIGLYANPQVIANPQIKAVVDSMAAQELLLMQEALALPAETPLGVVPTSTVTYSTDPLPLIVVNIPSPQNLGAAPVPSSTPTGPSQVSWKDAGGSVGIGLNGIDYPWDINEPSTIFNVFAFNTSAYKLPIVSATLSIGGQTYNGTLRPNITPYEVEFAVPILTVGGGSAGNGWIYPYTIQVNASGTYTTYSDSFEVPCPNNGGC